MNASWSERIHLRQARKANFEWRRRPTTAQHSSPTYSAVLSSLPRQLNNHSHPDNPHEEYMTNDV